MSDDIETLREFIAGELGDHRAETARETLAALERVATKQGHYRDALKDLREGLLRVETERDSLRKALDEAVRLRKMAEGEADSIRAKIDEIEQALTECGMPAQLGNPPEPWPARDRILGAYADYLKRHNEACKIDMENWSLRAALDRAKEALRRADQFITNGIELGFIRMPDEDTPDTAHETPALIRAVLSELSADAPAQQTQDARLEPGYTRDGLGRLFYKGVRKVEPGVPLSVQPGEPFIIDLPENTSPEQQTQISDEVREAMEKHS